MNLNRTIKLTKPIRQQIAENVQKGWLQEHPRPKVEVVPDGAQLKALAEWKEGKERVLGQTFTILETFSSVNQLQELWPAIMPFVPKSLVNPEQHVKLPKAA